MSKQDTLVESDEMPEEFTEQDEIYSYPIALTRQFRFCGNAFRVDMYRGCPFACSYCFANTRVAGKYDNKFSPTDFSIVEKLFNDAFESKEETSNITIELMRKRVPMHLGGISDPFQPLEFSKYGLTRKFLELTKKYNYPVLISTKNASLPDEYWAILDPEIHAFQVSLIGFYSEFIRKYEANTPLPAERLAFLKLASEKGFWTSIRIQPLIDLEEAKTLIKAAEPFIKYVTVEHLKIAADDQDRFSEEMGKMRYYKHKWNRFFEPTYEQKRSNILSLKEFTTVPIGVGDNELHELSMSRCCCGLDTIGNAFDNWMKYNYTFFATGNEPKSSVWSPKCNVNSSLNSTCRIKPFTTVKEYVEHYCSNFPHSVLTSQMRLDI